MKIHLRLALLSLVVNIVALGGATLVWNAGYQEQRRTELDERLRSQATALALLLPAPGQTEPRRYQDIAETLHRQNGNRITILLADGRVIADSTIPWE